MTKTIKLQLSKPNLTRSTSTLTRNLNPTKDLYFSFIKRWQIFKESFISPPNILFFFPPKTKEIFFWINRISGNAPVFFFLVLFPQETNHKRKMKNISTTDPNFIRIVEILDFETKNINLFNNLSHFTNHVLLYNWALASCILILVPSRLFFGFA